MARITSKRQKDFATTIAQARITLIENRAEYLQQEIKTAKRNADLLIALNAIVPLSASHYYELTGNVDIRLTDGKQATRVLRKLRKAGYVFSDASYDHAYRTSSGKDMLNVSRVVSSVEGDALASAVGVVGVTWQTEYKEGPRTKCKVVETATTYRSLVCAK